MSRFENKLCPVCRERFRDGDDITVCPECGTPHHRECYLKLNRCGLEEYHAEGFVWKGRLPDEPMQSMPSAAEIRSGVPEPIERKTNNLSDDTDADDTETDDTEIDDTETDDTEKTDDEQSGKTLEIFGLPDPDSDTFGGMGMDDPVKELYKMINDGAKGDDGVSMQELIAYTGTSIWHYSRAFRSFRNKGENGRRRVTSFNLCSGLFSPIFQFYRKMDVLGVILLILSVLPSFLIMSLSGGAMAQNTFESINTLLRLINVAECVLLCLFGDYLFYKQAVRRILKVRRSFGGDTGSIEYLHALSEQGRPSFARAMLGCLALMFANACIIAISGGAI